MKLPGFTAEAALATKPAGYLGVQRARRSLGQPGIIPAFIHRPPIPLPVPIDICGACISDCVHRGGNYFSCQNLCSFVCF
jgi:hypothetical protein